MSGKAPHVTLTTSAGRRDPDYAATHVDMPLKTVGWNHVAPLLDFLRVIRFAVTLV